MISIKKHHQIKENRNIGNQKSSDKYFQKINKQISRPSMN